MHLTNTLAAAIAALALAAGCSGFGASEQASLTEQPDGGTTTGCTLTQGFWKNHADAWPVDSLTLGTRVYAKAELLAIFDQPVRGNGLVLLAHQLIAAKLNVAAGAPDGEVASAIVDADALIGALVVPPVGTDRIAPSAASDVAGLLDEFNNGALGPPHCGDHVPPGDDDDGDCGDDSCHPPACGNGMVEDGEGCDDGNTVDGDGCSASCECECPAPEGPACGNGALEDGEQCDDGNTVDGDGCSASCTHESCP